MTEKNMEEQAVNNQAQQLPVNHVPVSKKPNQWAIAGIILILLLIFATIYIRSLPSRRPISPPPKPLASPPPTPPNPAPIVIPTTDPLITANWKTYTNTKHGYSFSYPSNWLILSPGGQYGDKCVNSIDKDDIIELAQKILDYCGFVGEQLPNSEAEFTIWVLDKPWEKKEILTTDATGTDISESIVVAGEKATKTPFTEKSYLPNIQATRIYVNHSSKGYLMFLKQTDKKGSYASVYDQILSTFKFTPASPTGGDQDQTVCTQDAKQCPDGSWVVRQPPACEFAKCP